MAHNILDDEKTVNFVGRRSKPALKGPWQQEKALERRDVWLPPVAPLLIGEPVIEDRLRIGHRQIGHGRA